MKNVQYTNANQHKQPAYTEIVKKNERETRMSSMLLNQSPRSSKGQQKMSSRSSTPQSSNTLSKNDNNKGFGKQANNENNQDPLSYYKSQTKELKKQLKDKENFINSLKADNEHLRTLNTEYVKSINDVIHKKVVNIESVVIDKALFEGPTFKSDSKKVIQKLEQNLAKVETQLKSFIKHCKVMEADIEIYKKKIIDADYILQGLKKTGEFSIDTLVYRLKYNDDRIKELEAENRQLQYDNCLNHEKLRSFELKYGDIELNYEDSKLEYQDLVTKHNRLISESEQRKNSDQRTIYEMKCQNDLLEHELRKMQNNLDSNNQEKIESSLKVVELIQQNDTLRSTCMSSKRNSCGIGSGYNVSFKQF